MLKFDTEAKLSFASLAIQRKKVGNVEKTRSDPRLVLKQRHAERIECEITIR